MEFVCRFCKGRNTESILPSEVLMEAAKEGHVSCMKTLIAAGADVNTKNKLSGATSLMYAVEGNHTQCVKLLIEAEADVNIGDQWGVTPVMCAKKPDSLELLIEAGADVNAVSTSGSTALVMVSSSGNISCVRLLIKAGADVNKARGSLTLAAGAGYSDCVEALLEAGADVNSSLNGHSALYAAISSDHNKCAELLIKAGADVNIRNRIGVTPLMNAVSRNNANNVRLLFVAKAKVNLKHGRHNALTAYVMNNPSRKKEMVMLLFAAGEILDDEMCPRLDPEVKHELIPSLDLKNICRKAVRKHLLDLDPYDNLFISIPQLGLPSLLTEYLLYDVSRSL